MRFLAVFILLSILVPSSLLWAGDTGKQYELRVLYLEFPPYYFTNNNGEPDGFLVKRADAILRRAGIIPRYESMTAKRVLQDMRTPNATCSIGWFKTPQRESFAKFSKPIYRNKSLEALFIRKDAHRFNGKDTFRQLLQDTSVVLGQVEGYSLGSVTDTLIMESGIKPHFVVGDYPQLVRMLAAEQFSYILVAPEEVDALIKKNRLASDLFETKQMSDIPAGNRRYLMFSRTVPDGIISRVDKAIQSMKK